MVKYLLTAALAVSASMAVAQNQGSLGNPGNGSFQSGIALMSGWHCDAEVIELQIDGGESLVASYGTSREDTRSICGDADNGFGLLFNMGLLSSGEHEVVAYADGVEFGRSTFTVTALSTGEFLAGAEKEIVVTDFPTAGNSVVLTWQQGNQNFMIKSESTSGSDGVQNVYTGGMVDARWNAGIMAFDEQIGYASCGGNGEDCPSVGWETVNDAERGSVLEVEYAGSGVAGLFFSADPNTDMSAYAGGTLNFDIKVVDEGTNASGFYMKVDCVFPCTSGDQAIGVVGLSGWETVSVDVDQLVGGGLDLSKVNTGLVLFPTAGEQQGVVYRLDNVYWQSGM